MHGIGQDRAHVRLQLGLELHVLAEDAHQQFVHVVDYRVQIDRPGAHHLLAAEREQLLGQGRRPIRRVTNRLGVGAHVAGRGLGVQHQPDVAANDRQQIIEIVGNSSSQIADCLHLLGLTQLVARVLQHQVSGTLLVVQLSGMLALLQVVQGGGLTAHLVGLAI